MFGHGKHRDEVYQRLGFYGCSRLVLDVELTELDGLLYHSSYGFGFIHCFLDGLVCHYYDWVHLKVWTELSRGYYQGECDLFHAWVLGLDPLESLANTIHRALHSLFFPN